GPARTGIRLLPKEGVWSLDISMISSSGASRKECRRVVHCCTFVIASRNGKTFHTFSTLYEWIGPTLAAPVNPVARRATLRPRSLGPIRRRAGCLHRSFRAENSTDWRLRRQTLDFLKSHMGQHCNAAGN